MKRITALILVFILLSFTLLGCQLEQAKIESPVNFYYPKDVYTFGTTDGVLGCEQRETAGYSVNYSYIMNLYLKGPISTSLVSPFPRGCAVISLKLQDECAYLVLNEAFAELKGLDLTLACISLARTLMEITNMKSVHFSVESRDLDGNEYILIQEENILLFDQSASPTIP